MRLEATSDPVLVLPGLGQVLLVDAGQRRVAGDVAAAPQELLGLALDRMGVREIAGELAGQRVCALVVEASTATPKRSASRPAIARSSVAITLATSTVSWSPARSATRISSS
jgi:hypothetical protein